MNRSLLARTAAAVTTLAAASAGALVVTAPAEAAVRTTDYSFVTYALGTRVTAQTAGLSSGPTAMSYIGCTRNAGVREDRYVAGGNSPANALGSLTMGTTSSHSETFQRHGAVGSLSTNSVATVTVGATNGPHLVLKGLQTTAQAWADKHGRLHNASSFKLADVVAKTGTPIDQVLNQAGVGFSDLAKTILAQPGDTLVIPDVGRLNLGTRTGRIYSSAASADAVALRLTLFGPDKVEGGGNDAKVLMGRSRAVIYRKTPAGNMSGSAYAADVDLLGGLVGVDQLGRRVLPCPGTQGRILENHVGLSSVTDVLGLGAATARVYGKQYASGSAVAWTEGRLETFNLGDGQLEMTGIVGRANVTKKADGKIVRTIAGTRIGSFEFQGEARDLPEFGQSVDLPGLGTLRYGIVDRSNPHAISVTAIRIVLVPAAAEQFGVTTINLGSAFTKLH